MSWSLIYPWVIRAGQRVLFGFFLSKVLSCFEFVVEVDCFGGGGGHIDWGKVWLCIDMDWFVRSFLREEEATNKMLMWEQRQSEPCTVQQERYHVNAGSDGITRSIFTDCSIVRTRWSVLSFLDHSSIKKSLSLLTCIVVGINYTHRKAQYCPESSYITTFDPSLG